ncbi:phosphotriesterase family protein [Sporosarcina obsidiansis]|uniref:phosphotriesterase family protein n=1 Tax=Sporosarcina obsidiansis TaxID=2660748 RepID=UPI00129A4174|nr:hypothetical protein [Sporosarcina obsidiansis]
MSKSTDVKRLVTVNGEILLSDMGICHSHEHLFIKKGQPEKLDPALLLDDFDKTKEEVLRFKELGGNTIVDAQPVGSGRNADWLQKLSEETGINILASTGFHKHGFYKEGHWIRESTETELAKLFIDELENGMYCDGEENWPRQQLNAKAGLIKTAAGLEGTAGSYFPLFKAAARAAYETNTSIMTHTELGYNALEQIKLYTDLGIKEEKLIVCHLDRKMDNADYLLYVASTGVYLELDTIGRFKYHSDEEEVSLISKLINNGYEDQLLLGLDTTRKRMKSYGGSIGLEHLQGKFLPILEKAGITKVQIHKMMHTNPAKAFSK